MTAPIGPADLLANHLVIGGGPAGSMLALRLAAAGRRVTLVEREPAAHHKVCGEFLSREAVYYLRQAGIDPLALGAQLIRTVRISWGRNAVSAPLPFQALSLSRRALDQALLERAAQSCDVLRGVAVESLAAAGQHWIAHLAGGHALKASAVFLATGKHDLRGFARPGGRQSGLVGFKMHFALAPAKTAALRHRMELYLYPGGYGGLSLVEEDAANLCLVVRRSALRKLGGWSQLLDCILRHNRPLRALLDGAAPLAPKPLAIAPIPYGYLAAESDGLWRIGDQAAVIPSFTGDGMSIAMHSAALAAQMFLAGKPSSDYAAVLRRQLRRQMTLATGLSQAAVTRTGRAAAFAILPLAPGVLRWIATSTRIPWSLLVVGMGTEAGAELQAMRC